MVCLLSNGVVLTIAQSDTPHACRVVTFLFTSQGGT